MDSVCPCAYGPFTHLLLEIDVSQFINISVRPPVLPYILDVVYLGKLLVNTKLYYQSLLFTN
jgi:hypothetical protein